MYSLMNMKKNYVPTKVPELSKEDMQWFRDSKFGMFIHWGVYSLLGKGEWVLFNERLNVTEYEKLASRFDVQKFDAKEWAKAAKNAGMKYMVLTAKHHDGFCLFDSKVSKFTSTNSAAERDFVREYVEACRDEGLKVGLYYSPMDWRFSGYFFPEMYHESALALKQQCWEQIRELMTNYGKIDLLWYDGEWLAHGGMKFSWDRNPRGWYSDDWDKVDYKNEELFGPANVNYFWESEKLNTFVRELQPGIMINNRSGWVGDFHVRERHLGEVRTDKPWEASDCLTGSWGWIPDLPMLSLRECINALVGTVVRDGTFLLNIGPTGDGDIEARQIKRIAQIGDWIAIYEQAIYNTRGGPVIAGSWGGSNYRDKTMYIHILEWKEDEIRIPTLENNKLISFNSLNSKNVSVIHDNDIIVLSVPIQDRDAIDTIIVLEFENTIKWSGITSTEIGYQFLADGL